MKIEVSIVADDAQVLDDKTQSVSEFVKNCLWSANELANWSARLNAKASFESDKVTISVTTDTAFRELMQKAKETNK